MKKTSLVLSLITSGFIITMLSGCPAASVSTAGVSQSPGDYSRPVPSSAPTSGLDNLRLGVLPDPSLSTEEQKLAGLLARKANPEFPLKLGVLLYKANSNLPEKNRNEFYNGFLKKLGENPDVAQVTEISPSLVTLGANIEDIRKLAARFQVSTLLLVNDSYQQVIENKDAIVTPVDIITGNRNWESYSKIELFALDILNGVFVYTTSAIAKQGDKYNKLNPSVNKDEKLSIESARDSWNMLAEKVAVQISEFKKQLATTPTNP